MSHLAPDDTPRSGRRHVTSRRLRKNVKRDPLVDPRVVVRPNRCDIRTGITEGPDARFVRPFEWSIVESANGCGPMFRLREGLEAWVIPGRQLLVGPAEVQNETPAKKDQE